MVIWDLDYVTNRFFKPMNFLGCQYMVAHELKEHQWCLIQDFIEQNEALTSYVMVNPKPEYSRLYSPISCVWGFWRYGLHKQYSILYFQRRPTQVTKVQVSLTLWTLSVLHHQRVTDDAAGPHAILSESRTCTLAELFLPTYFIRQYV